MTQKTEVILFGTDNVRKNVNFDNLDVGDANVNVIRSGAVRNLGVYFDSDLSMRTHITNICQAAHFSLRNIGKIRNILDEESCKIVIHSLVTSKLD